MKNLLAYLLSGILGKDDFAINEEAQENGFLKLSVTTKPENMGLLIGKDGRIIKSIRSLLRARATLDKIGFSLEINEDNSVSQK